MIQPDQILTADQMRAAEQALFDKGETPERLTERAGAGAADWVRRICAGRAVTVLCGPGNNGGDGYVIARLLEQQGVPVSVIAPLEPKTEAAQIARRKWGGEPVQTASGNVLVDVLFGTGISRELPEHLQNTLCALAESHEIRIAIDLPSGIESDFGQILGTEPPVFDHTIALGAWKMAHWLMPAARFMGQRHLVDIGIGAVADTARLAPRPKLYKPAADAHKYTRGLAVIIGGAMPGAAILAARGAQHGGAGYVKLASAQSHAALPVDVVQDAGDLAVALDDRRIGAVLIGPGLGRGEDAQQRLRTVLSAGHAVVLDADALALLTPEHLPTGCAHILCTPHEGELDRLCDTFGISAPAKLDKARALHAATSLTILAKGADTILAGESGITLFPPASSWLSTAGTGDVFAGLCVSRMAMGERAEQAARHAVALHSEAARRAPPTFTASQLADHLPAAYGALL